MASPEPSVADLQISVPPVSGSQGNGAPAAVAAPTAAATTLGRTPKSLDSTGSGVGRPAVGARKIIDRIKAIQALTAPRPVAAGSDGAPVLAAGAGSEDVVELDGRPVALDEHRQGTVISFEFFPAKVGACSWRWQALAVSPGALPWLLRRLVA